MREISRGRRVRLLAIGTSLATAVTLGLTPTGQASDAPVARTVPRSSSAANEVSAPVPTVAWSRCDGGLQCGVARVPLDYDHPSGPTTRLFMIRHRATHPADRIGTLFVNPGGPGGSAADFVSYAVDVLGARVKARFDIVGIDPRGVGGSTAVRCRTTAPPPPYPRGSFPLRANQAAPYLKQGAYLRHACRSDGNAILDHMTTADTARDMDLIRQALGDAKLTYYGVSYGTYLGATYAAMFPNRVRALIVDGVLDPIAWATGRHGRGTKLPFSTRVRSGVGAYHALVSAFTECDQVGKLRCRFTGDAYGKWLRIVRVLKQGPVTIPLRGSVKYSQLVSGVLGSLYDRSSYRYLMRELNVIYRGMFKTRSTHAAVAAIERLQARAERSDRGPYGASLQANVFQPSFEGVACADSVNPSDPKAWIRAGRIADRLGPWFGRLWTWASVACPRWPGSDADAFRGPWRVTTSAPLLVVGNAHDPATPISGARALNSLFTGSRLLSLDTWGHGAIGQSKCVTGWFQRYLISGALPAEGRVCQPDKVLYPRPK